MLHHLHQIQANKQNMAAGCNAGDKQRDYGVNTEYYKGHEQGREDMGEQLALVLAETKN